MMMMASNHQCYVKTNSVKLYGTVFDVTNRYQNNVEPIGMGAFGLVCACTDNVKATRVAIKKISKPFVSAVLAKRTLRELKLLTRLRHENIIFIQDMYLSVNDDIYFVTELLGTDLQRLLSSRKLELHYIQYFIYQMLRGLKYVHSAGVVHRDLKPSNILINENCDLKICDFGLARLADTQMTGYVSTRFYRAPEIMLTWQKYDKAVDIWSCGCILGEMLLGKAMFPGKDHVNQFSLIIDLLGTPPPEVMNRICSENTLRFVQSLPVKEKVDFKLYFRDLDPVALDLMELMLNLDPQKRITAEAALEHPFVAEFHDPEEETVASSIFDWATLDKDLTAEEWRELVFQELESFYSANPDPHREIVSPSSATEEDISVISG